MADIREIIIQPSSTDALHETRLQPNRSQIEAGCRIDEALTAPEPTFISVFDDVLTTGTRLRAATRYRRASRARRPAACSLPAECRVLTGRRDRRGHLQRTADPTLGVQCCAGVERVPRPAPTWSHQWQLPGRARFSLGPGRRPGTRWEGENRSHSQSIAPQPSIADRSTRSVVHLLFGWRMD